ncbi:CLUMA_CG013099, isoform A [Clunio marinus]|uniref:CLUMA_CG013099, isoform A n=1 Tax=Clunio marinus TaxID=568069 RepID=A0A1J1IHQ4_9DIPT|nr:CLUMA_CG013099, isoform A [Clunio marinus]
MSVGVQILNEMEQKIESVTPPRTCEIKFVIKSIIPVTTDFTSVIKNSNDSQDELLEFRSLTSNSFKVNGGNIIKEKSENNKSYSADVKEFIEKIMSREKSEETTEADELKNDSSMKNDSAESISELVITKKQKINSLEGSPAAFGTMSSSTPIKADHRNINLDISGVGLLSFADDKVEAGKDPKNNSLNDSDFESMDQDQYDESLKQSTKDTTLVRNRTFNSSENKENISEISRSSSLSDFKNGFKMILEETVKRTPLAIRKAFNIESDSGSATSSVKKSKFFNIFSSTKKLKRKQSPSKKRHSRKSTSTKKKSLLTRENLQKYLQDGSPDKATIEWGDNFEYSFICEPPSSEIDESENSPNYISYNASLDSSIEMLKSPLIPTFKIDPPSESASNTSSYLTLPNDSYPPACDYVKHMIKCSYASKLPLSTSFRRSISEPAIEDNLETNDDLFKFTISKANTTQTCEASIKNLTQLSGLKTFNEFKKSFVKSSQSFKMFVNEYVKNINQWKTKPIDIGK